MQFISVKQNHRNQKIKKMKRQKYLSFIFLSFDFFSKNKDKCFSILSKFFKADGYYHDTDVHTKLMFVID